MTHQFDIGACLIRFFPEIPVEEPDPDAEGSHSPAPATVCVFLHSANYRFSLGSGASKVVRRIIDAEREQHGKSALERSIQKIKKTPVGRVRVTAGGDLPRTFSVHQPREMRCPNFDFIVHAVIPGPRIDGFEATVREMMRAVFQEVSNLVRGGKTLDFCLPVVGVNNFGYPLATMAGLYAEEITRWIRNDAVHGRICLWLQEKHMGALAGALRTALLDETI